MYYVNITHPSGGFEGYGQGALEMRGCGFVCITEYETSYSVSPGWETLELARMESSIQAARWQYTNVDYRPSAE